MNWSVGLDGGGWTTSRGLDPGPAVRRIKPAETTNAVDALQHMSQLPNGAPSRRSGASAFYQ
jgi:hypothetical protein